MAKTALYKKNQSVHTCIHTYVKQLFRVEENCVKRQNPTSKRNGRFIAAALSAWREGGLWGRCYDHNFLRKNWRFS
jgi:hypothetical protein